MSQTVRQMKHAHATPEAATPPAPAPAEQDPEDAPKVAPLRAVADGVPPPGEWGQTRPSEKRMGLVHLTLDEGVKTTIVGHVYGLDFHIDGPGYTTRVFFDYYSRRLKVLEFDASDWIALTSRWEYLARANHFDKIFLKATKDDWQTFLSFGFVLEGILKYYFRGEDAYVLSRFRTLERITSERLIEESELIAKLMRMPREVEPNPLPEGYRLEVATPAHIPALVRLYRHVFETYPNPLTHPDYLLQTMERNVLYRVIVNAEGEVVSAASAEMEPKVGAAEMTDCATMPSERSRGLMVLLLRALEADLRERGIRTPYTLARAKSIGMNRVFYRLGYEYSGRLVNNCDIYGEYEDMNIWVKRLPEL
ncbi:MAG: hypothetical protein AMXMBFR64_30230 [Myxococcales bacterium]